MFPNLNEINQIIIKQFKISKLEDYDDLAKAINNPLYMEKSKENYIEELKQRIGLNISHILIEFPYVDFDYSSTYSSFHSKKHLKLPKETIRLSFFKDDKFMGFMTIRPSNLEGYGNKRGKAYISPEILCNNDESFMMLTEAKAHILSNEYKVLAFPWMAQETDISVCAHMSCWNVARYFSLKLSKYATYTVNDIVELTPNNDGREIPSEGLYFSQMSGILKKTGQFPLILQKDKANPEYLHQRIYSYIESGIPVMVGLEKGNVGHAITLIGHGKVNYDKLDKIDKEYIFSSELIDTFISINDNYLLYQRFSENDEGVRFTTQNISHALIPLHEKMLYSIDNVIEKFDQWKKAGMIKLKKNSVVRIYLTSSKSFKFGVSKATDMEENLLSLFLTTPLPKFIWVIDISTKEEYKNSLVSQRMIIDTTSDTKSWNPWLIVQHENEVYIKERNYGQLLKVSGINKTKPYTLYKNNLEYIKKGS